MNLHNQAISTYGNFNFNSIANYKGTLLAADDTGIYILGGDTDNGAEIGIDIKTGSMDFGEALIKYARDLWITHRTSNPLRIRMYVDEKTNEIIEKYTTIIDGKMNEERVKPPRGLKGRFYTIEIKNVHGADVDIDSLSMLVESVKRKIR